MISILYGGGTISSLPTSEGFRTAANVDLIDTLFKTNPDLSATLKSSRIWYGTSSAFSQVYDGMSENIDSIRMKIIASKVEEAITDQNPQAVLMTFGTDTMLQMGQYLQVFLGEMLAECKIPFVITGANRDTSHPATDAWDNLAFAVKSLETAPCQVSIAFGGKLIPVFDAVMEPFDGDSMKFGYKGSAELNVKLEAQSKKREDLVEPFRVPIETGLERKVMLYSVNKPDIFNHTSLLQSIEMLDTKIVVFVLYHSGTANVESNIASISDLVTELRETNKITCFGATENGEPTGLDLYESSVALRKAGLVPLYNMDYLVALEKAKYILQLGVDPYRYIEAMYTDCFGEIDPKLINEEHKNELITLYGEIDRM